MLQDVFFVMIVDVNVVIIQYCCNTVTVSNCMMCDLITCRNWYKGIVDVFYQETKYVTLLTFWQLINFFVYLLVKFIKHNQNYYLKLDVSTSIRGLHQKKLVLSSSGS